MNTFWHDTYDCTFHMSKSDPSFPCQWTLLTFLQHKMYILSQIRNTNSHILYFISSPFLQVTVKLEHRSIHKVCITRWAPYLVMYSSATYLLFVSIVGWGPYLVMCTVLLPVLILVCVCSGVSSLPCNVHCFDTGCVVVWAPYLAMSTVLILIVCIMGWAPYLVMYTVLLPV